MLTTKQNRQRHSKLAKYHSKRRPQKKPRPSQRPPHLQMKHERRVIHISLKRYDTSGGFWPIEALIKLADLGVYSAIEYYEQLITECIAGRVAHAADPAKPKQVSPRRIYENRPLEDKYFHGIPNNTSFQKLLARLQASTPKVNNA